MRGAAVVGGALGAMAALSCALVLSPTAVRYDDASAADGAKSGDAEGDGGPCTPTCLSGACTAATFAKPGGTNLVLRGDTLYWNQGGQIFARSTRDPDVGPGLYADTDGAGAFALDGTRVYYLSISASELKACDAPCKGNDVLATPAQGALDVTLDATYVYWSDAGGVHRMPKAGGPIDTYTIEADGHVLAVDDHGVYFRSDCDVASFPKDDPSGVPNDFVQDLCAGGSQPRRMAFAPPYLFATDGTSIDRVTLPAGALANVSAASDARGLTAYCGTLYWAEATRVAALPFGAFVPDGGALDAATVAPVGGAHVAVDATGIYVFTGSEITRIAPP